MTSVTVAFILMTQIPNIANMAFQRQRSEKKVTDKQKEMDDKPRNMQVKAELSKQLSKDESDPLEYARRLAELTDKSAAVKQKKKDHRFRVIRDTAVVANMAIPVG